MQLKPNHVKFVQLIVQGLTQVEAYRTSIGDKNTSLSTAEAKASNLVKKYATLIQQERDKLNEAVSIKVIDKLSNLEVKKVLSVIERKHILSEIATGEVKIKKFIVCDGIIEERDAVPDSTDRKNAIAEFNKMEGAYTPINVANTDKSGKDLEHYAILPDGTKLKL